MWVCSYGVPECPICKRNRLSIEEAQKQESKAKAILERAQRGLIAGNVTVKVDRLTGKVTFNGIAQEDRAAGASDECLLRALMVSGSSLALGQIAKAQRLAGRATLTARGSA